MAGLCRREREAHGGRIAHLADDDDVWGLSNRRAQRPGKVFDVYPEFLLLDEAPIVRVLELDRILDRDDVLRVPVIDLRYERCQRRRLPGSCRTTDQDQTPAQAHHDIQRMRESEIGQLRNGPRKRTYRRCRSAALA